MFLYSFFYNSDENPITNVLDRLIIKAKKNLLENKCIDRNRPIFYDELSRVY